MRLIDADVIIEPLKTMEAAFEEISIASVIRDLKDAPTIDPESLRPQGEWEEYPDWAHIRCTNCKREFKKSEFAIKMKPFCPNCGAKMKEKGE